MDHKLASSPSCTKLGWSWSVVFTMFKPYRNAQGQSLGLYQNESHGVTMMSQRPVEESKEIKKSSSNVFHLQIIFSISSAMADCTIWSSSPCLQEPSRCPSVSSSSHPVTRQWEEVLLPGTARTAATLHDFLMAVIHSLKLIRENSYYFQNCVCKELHIFLFDSRSSVGQGSTSHIFSDLFSCVRMGLHSVQRLQCFFQKTNPVQHEEYYC